MKIQRATSIRNKLYLTQTILLFVCIGIPSAAFLIFYAQEPSKAAQQLIEVVFYSFLAALVLGIWLSLFLVKHILSPLYKVTKGAERITQGHIDHKIELQRDDEFGRLADSVNRLTTALISANQSLEQKVHEKTAELEELNSNLEQIVEIRTEEMQQAIERAKQASTAKSDFLAMMSHEIRTPMNGIVASLDLLKHTQINYEQMDLVDTAKSSALNLVAILNDILDISKIEAGKFELEQTEFLLSETLDSVVKTFVPSTLELGLIFEVREQSDMPDKMIGDPVRIRQVLFNIVGNAIKFTAKQTSRVGKIVVDVSIEDESDTNYTLAFRIKDNGIGIHKDVQAKLFQPFKQAEKSTSRKFGGTGLGLAICKKLVEMMHGDITLTSKEGEGTEFCIYLNLGKVEALDEDLPPLFGRELHFIECNPYLQKLARRLVDYAESEGGEAYCHDWQAIAQSDQLATMAGSVILMLGEIEPYQHILSAFEQLPCPDGYKMVAVERNDLEHLRNLHPTMPALPIKPLTKFQFIKYVMAEEQADELLQSDTSIQTAVQTQDLDQKLNVGDEEVLLVEDNPLNQKLIKKQLKVLGVDPAVANDGYEGLQAFKNHSYKLVITDCHMPNLSGYDMVHLIRQYENEQGLTPTPIVALTGAAMAGDKEKCLKVGMNDFLSKPVQTDELKKVVNQHLSD
ncbi:histidine kinase [Catenovulum agarivorans DS-2]|uniref:histidine kinase n=1 Tax=Catenovulum agarivorans DS-2 TaxID=1328313 RepID=W7QPY7_9ALTE|nr:ATP-binding protein [Catenovulum agarivorans]EWH11052.1 histidine kinase [Catenovulum agarivorans DS-2]